MKLQFCNYDIIISGSVLRPSQLKPGTNPFLKVTEEKEEKVDEDETETPADDRLNDKEDAEAPKFVPLGSANVTPRTTAPAPATAQPATSNSSSGFVFGQNLSERVVMQQNMNNGEAAPLDHSSTNGTTELLFTSAAASVKDSNQVRHFFLFLIQIQEVCSCWYYAFLSLYVDKICFSM